jgi:hypothetical protein
MIFGNEFQLLELYKGGFRLLALANIHLSSLIQVAQAQAL